MAAPFEFNKIEELIEDIRKGKIVVLIDDEDRENEGDLILAADHVTPEAINFMALEARGLICLALAKEQVEKLKIPLMVRDEENETPNKTAFTVSIESATGVSTGISAADRAHTIKVASSKNAKPSDVKAPGHVFPIRAQAGGVLKRAGHTEGSVDLARLAGLNPAAVICEVMNVDGTMARVPDLIQFAKKHGFKIGTIVDLIQYRLQTESLLVETASYSSEQFVGEGVQVKVFQSEVDGTEHLVLQKGVIQEGKPTLVRVHVESQLHDSMSTFLKTETTLTLAQKFIENQDGVLVILRGISKPTSMLNVIQQWKNTHGVVASTGKTEQSSGPLKSMDQRDYGIGAQILRALGVHKIKLLSNSIEKRVGLKAYGLEIVEVIPLTEESYNEICGSETRVLNEKNKNRHSYGTLQ